MDNISDKDIMEVNIPTAVPLVYELDRNLKPIKSYYLMGDEELKKKMDEVASQGKMKKWKNEKIILIKIYLLWFSIKKFK